MDCYSRLNQDTRQPDQDDFYQDRITVHGDLKYFGKHLKLHINCFSTDLA